MLAGDVYPLRYCLVTRIVQNKKLRNGYGAQAG
jgi:hypothetical protein